MRENIQETIRSQVSAILHNISYLKKQDKLYLAIAHENELEKIVEQIEMLEIKTRKEIEK